MPDIRRSSRRDIFHHFGFVWLRFRSGTQFIAVVDRVDWPAVCRIKWQPHQREDGAISARAFVQGKWVYLRHLVATAALGPRPSDQHVCEHLNGDLLDCRRANIAWTHRNSTEYRKQERAADKALKRKEERRQRARKRAA